MKNFKRILCAAIILLSVISFSVAGKADFGDFAGDSDFGDSYDSGDSYDFGDSYDSYSSDDSSGDYNTKDIMLISLVGVVIAFGFFVCKIFMLEDTDQYQKDYRRPSPNKESPSLTEPSTLRPMSWYPEKDKNFSSEIFKENISNLYVKLQESWQNKDIHSLRPYLSDVLYLQSEKQLNHYRINCQTNVVEHIAVLDVKLSGWKQESGNDIIIAVLKTRITDYVVDDKTGNVVKGRRDKEKFMTYEWTLRRTSGKTTGITSGVTTLNCPNCGAPLDVNNTAECEYCGSIVTSDSFDWVLSNIKCISQVTN